MSEGESTVDGSRFWALLVGIDKYPAPLPQLAGCRRDIEGLRDFLVDQLKVPERQIFTLLDAAATRDGILGAIRQRLIENPDILRGDQILIQYSGHGAQMKRADDSGTCDEAIVPWDGRLGGSYDIRDKTLGALLAELAEKKGDHITLVLDSCHSGDVVRNEGQARARTAPKDPRIPPEDLDAKWLRPLSGAQRGAGKSLKDAEIPYVLLAGCRDTESAYEHVESEGNAAPLSHGAMTYALLENLQKPENYRQLTYGELHQRIANWVSTNYPRQHPQCEGDRNRLVFGGLRVEREPFLNVIEGGGGTVSLDGGRTLGIRPGTIIALYPSTVRTRQDLPESPLATAEVLSAGATRCRARLVEPGGADSLLHARALIREQPAPDLQLAVHLNQPAEGPRQELLALAELLRKSTHTSTAYVRPAPPNADPESVVALHVTIAEGKFRITGADKGLLAEVELSDGPHRTLQALQSIARFRWLSQLTNTDHASRVANRIQLRLRRRLSNSAVEAGDRGLELLHDEWNLEGNQYIVEVTNDSPVPVFPHLFTLSQDFSVTRLYPAFGQEVALPAGATLRAGERDLQEVLEVYLPADWQRSEDAVLAIVTTEQGDLSLLEQPALDVPPQRALRGNPTALEKLLFQRLSEPGKRLARPLQAGGLEDWGTALLKFEVVREGEADVSREKS